MERKEFLVCIDADGCLLDNMELKHKECFCPALVNIWNLQCVSRYAREEWQHVNLYSRSRGKNRFLALPEALQRIYNRPEVKAMGMHCPDLNDLIRWTKETPELSARACKEYAEKHPELSGVMKTAADWSAEVDANIKRIVRGIRPFVNVEDTLRYLNTFADVVVVSATPTEALERELRNCGVFDYFVRVFGQDAGTKAVCIEKMLKEGYDPDKTLKVGDAFGDLQAANTNHVLFYPIKPSKEVESWYDLGHIYADIFKTGKYKGKVMAEKVQEFLDILPE